MPYIKPEHRDRYIPLIVESVHTIMDGNETKLVKGEFFGHLVSRIFKGYMNTLDKTGHSFNSSLFSPAKQKQLSELATKFLVFLNQEDPLSSAGELNYVVSAVFWGIQGHANGVESANYAFRTYLRSMLEQIRNQLPNAPFPTTGEQRERLQAGRRFSVALGVICDVITEGYNQVTAVYEEIKRDENGTIWTDGQLKKGN